MVGRSLTIVALAGVLAGGLAAIPAQARTSGKAAHHHGTASAHTADIAGEFAALTARRRGTLTGMVYGADGRPLTGACVTAIGATGSAMTMTRADGRYTLTALRPGRYALRYATCASGPEHGQIVAGLGLPRHPAADPMTHAVLVPGQVTALPTVTLATPGPPTAFAARRHGRTATAASSAGTGQIRGVVSGGGHPVAGVCVLAFPLSSGSGATALTSANGHYTLRRVPVGRYQVEFASSDECPDPGNWLSQWYKGVTSPFLTGKATVVRVAKNKITRGIDASLRRGGEISGTVRSKSGKPLGGICVTVIGRVSGGFVELTPRTGKHGRYVAHGLFKGSYVVGFRTGCGGGNYAPQWWPHAATQRAAAHIHIAGARKIAGVDGALEPGSAITGVVRAGSASGPRLRGICVDAFNPHTGISADSRTHKDGSYKLIGLAAGTYFVQYQTGCGNNGNYLETSQTVKVGARETRRGVNVFLLPGAGISGTVTNTHGKPVGGICVEIDSSHGFGFGMETSDDGSYSATGLNPGTYTARFSGGCGNSGSYVPIYYKGKTTHAAADPVVLLAGQVTTGIDAVMPPGATISGLLTDAAGHRLSDICVGIASRSEQLLGDGEFTDIEFTSNGSYRASNLSPGVYAVDLGCGVGRVANEWFRSHRTAEGADLVSAAAGWITSGIGAVMHPAGSITGTVTSRAGKPLNGLCVLAVPAGAPYLALFGGSGPVTRKGTYHIAHLLAGRYDIQFSTCINGHYGSQWYRAERTQGQATPVSVRYGRATLNIDAKLNVGGSIVGHVVTSTGRPRPGFCVEAYDAATQSFRLAPIDRVGGYRIAGLSTGRYQIIAVDCAGGTKASITRPGRVRVHAPQAATGIYVRLPAGGSLSGTVLASGQPAARSDICVIIVPVKQDGSFGFAGTSQDGTYKVSGLAEGQYQVNFSDPYCFSPDDDLAPQWFDDQLTQATAKLVTVTAGATTGGINATLGANGSISGSVTDQAHAPIAGECVSAIPVGAEPDLLLGVSQQPEIAVTGAAGGYSLAGVLPGRYKVRFSSGCRGTTFTTQWWQDADSRATATVITVGAGTAVTGIDAALTH